MTEDLTQSQKDALGMMGLAARTDFVGDLAELKAAAEAENHSREDIETACDVWTGALRSRYRGFSLMLLGRNRRVESTEVAPNALEQELLQSWAEKTRSFAMTIIATLVLLKIGAVVLVLASGEGEILSMLAYGLIALLVLAIATPFIPLVSRFVCLRAAEAVRTRSEPVLQAYIAHWMMSEYMHDFSSRALIQLERMQNQTGRVRIVTETSNREFPVLEARKMLCDVMAASGCPAPLRWLALRCDRLDTQSFRLPAMSRHDLLKFIAPVPAANKEAAA